jgi:hypothetical protein
LLCDLYDKERHMKNLIYDFWTDQSGMIVSAEIVIVGTVLVLGLIVGLNAAQSAIVFELNDIARAFCSLNQSYWFSGFRGCKARVPGSAYTDINTCARLCFLTGDIVVSGVSQGGIVDMNMDFGVGGAAVSVAPPAPITAPATPAPAVTPAPACPTDCPPSVIPQSPCPPVVCPPAAPMLPMPDNTCSPTSVIMPPGYAAPQTAPPVLMVR